MGKPVRLAQAQRRALDRLSELHSVRGFYLAGGTAIALHLQHRRSLDLDLFSLSMDADLAALHAEVQAKLPEARAYLQRFGVAEADLYHVLRALTYFGDADADPVLPPGLTASMWEEIKSYFQAEAPKLLLEPRPTVRASPSRSTGARSGSKKKV